MVSEVDEGLSIKSIRIACLSQEKRLTNTIAPHLEYATSSQHHVSAYSKLAIMNYRVRNKIMKLSKTPELTPSAVPRFFFVDATSSDLVL